MHVSKFTAGICKAKDVLGGARVAPGSKLTWFVSHDASMMVLAPAARRPSSRAEVWLRLLPVVAFARGAAPSSADSKQAATDKLVQDCNANDRHCDVLAVDMNAVTLRWPSTAVSTEPSVSELPAGWLRERCTNAESTHLQTRQPLGRYHDLNAQAHEVGGAQLLCEGTLEVSFKDGQVCRFSTARLHTEIVDFGAGHIQPALFQAPPKLLWGGGEGQIKLGAPPAFEYTELSTEAGKYRVATQLLTVGIVLIHGVPAVSGKVVELADELAMGRPTNWGHPFNVRTEGDVQEGRAEPMLDLAYSKQVLGFHTDNPYRMQPPGYQLLHALEHCTCPTGSVPPCPSCSVMNHAVDGHAVALQLLREDPEGFDLLCNTSVRFENDGGDGKSAMVNLAPIIELVHGSANRFTGRSGTMNTTGAAEPLIRAIQFSAKSGGYAPLLPPAQAARFYAARRRFSELLDAPTNVVSFQLRPGTAWIFDNQRVLHARGAMGEHDGARHLQGAYMDRAMLWYKFEKWRRARAANINPMDPAHRMTAGGGFTSLVSGTATEFAAMGAAYAARVDGVAAKTLLSMLEAQRGDTLGQPIDLYDHGLQTASRALRAGEPDELVVVSLLHDLTETVLSKNHGGTVAALLAPWISPESQWLLEHHEVFQGKYYLHHFGVNPDLRDRWRDHPHYNATARWCELYDQASFDPAYPNLPIDVFAPLLDRLLAREAYWWDTSHPKRFAVTGKE